MIMAEKKRNIEVSFSGTERIIPVETLEEARAYKERDVIILCAGLKSRFSTENTLKTYKQGIQICHNFMKFTTK